MEYSLEKLTSVPRGTIVIDLPNGRDGEKECSSLVTELIAESTRLAQVNRSGFNRGK